MTLNKQLVKVTWVDSLSSTGLWIWDDTIDPDDIKEQMYNESVGWVVYRDEEIICLSADVKTKKAEDGTQSVTDPIKIPVRIITKIEELHVK